MSVFLQVKESNLLKDALRPPGVLCEMMFIMFIYAAYDVWHLRAWYAVIWQSCIICVSLSLGEMEE